MKNLFHLTGASRVILLLALELGSCLAFATDQKPDETFDFGKGILGSEVSHDFHLTNAGSSQMTIDEVETSCPCTRIVSFPKTIAAGQTGVISIDTRLDRLGDKEVIVTALSGGNNSPHLFSIKGMVLAAASVDPDLFVEPKKLLEVAKTEVMYVDIRPNIAFNEARIPASINVPLFALSARTYLKSRPLVIVGSGIDDMALVAPAEACRKEGFTSIRIMRGGIRQWQQAGGSLEGVFSQRPPVNEMTAAQLLTSADHAPWLVLVPKVAPTNIKFGGETQLQIISYSDLKSIEDVMKAAIAKNTTISGVAVFADNGQDLTTLSRKVPTLDRPLFTVSDPWSAFTTLASSGLQASDAAPIVKSVVSGSLARKIIGCPTCP